MTSAMSTYVVFAGNAPSVMTVTCVTTATCPTSMTCRTSSSDLTLKTLLGNRSSFNVSVALCLLPAVAWGFVGFDDEERPIYQNVLCCIVSGIRRTSDAAATLVYSFVSSGLD